MSPNRAPELRSDQEQIANVTPVTPEAAAPEHEVAQVTAPTPRERIRSLMGRAFRFEQGPNAHTPEVRAEHDPFDQD